MNAWTTGRVAALLAATAIGVGAALGTGGPVGAAGGGGDWVYPARDRYEAGQTVTMIGWGSDADAALRAQGPFYAWLRVDPTVAEAAGGLPWPGVHPSDRRVGEVLIEDVAPPADPGSVFVRGPRLSVTFDLPADLPDGAFHVLLCNDPCTAGPGNFVAETIHVGVDPASPIVRDWPLTEPAIRWLEDDALLSLSGGTSITAAEVRAGAVPPAAPAPAPEPTAAVETTAPPVAAGQLRGRADVAAGDDVDGRIDGDRPADDDGSGDGGAAARWVAIEIAVLVGAAVAALTWTARRRSGGDAADPAAGPPAGAEPPTAGVRPADASTADRGAAATRGTDRRPPVRL